jgi:hypothetical protein
MFTLKPIWFYWDGPISESRLQILKDAIYSTRVFNPNHYICLVSNTLKSSDFDPKYYINVNTWNETIFQGLPLTPERIQKYINAHPRELSDLMRLVLLYQWGGSYIDTDDLGIKPMSETPNLICRSYDPHTSFYNKVTDDQCVPGKIKEIEGFEGINTFPRNDCWHNWQPKSDFIKQLLWNDKFVNADNVVYIGDDWSWQSLTNETIIKNLDSWKTEWNYGLTLLYLYEDFVSACSYWDRCQHGGEMCEIWGGLPNVKDYEWGFYKTDRETALAFYKVVAQKYPNLSHMWLHSKDMKEEWLLPELNPNELYSVSTWIYDEIKQQIKCFQ